MLFGLEHNHPQGVILAQVKGGVDHLCQGVVQLFASQCTTFDGQRFCAHLLPALTLVIHKEAGPQDRVPIGQQLHYPHQLLAIGVAVQPQQ